MKRSLSIAGAAFVAACVLGLGAGTAQASLIVATGNNPQIDDNVIANGCTSPITGPALIVEGCLNTSHTTIVRFESDENVLYDGGQASVDAPDVVVGVRSNGNPILAAGMYSYLKTSIVGNTFDTMILNIIAGANGNVTFTDGVTTSSLFAISGNGSNFFTLTGGPFGFISFTTFDVAGTTETDIVESTRQIRLGVTPDPDQQCTNCGQSVPEPGPLALVALGLLSLLAFGFTAQYRNRHG